MCMRRMFQPRDVLVLAIVTALCVGVALDHGLRRSRRGGGGLHGTALRSGASFRGFYQADRYRNAKL